jgi:hypothetical protein
MADTKDEGLQAWLVQAAEDARRRGLTELLPLVESLGLALAALRAADWNDDAGGTSRRGRRDNGAGQ